MMKGGTTTCAERKKKKAKKIRMGQKNSRYPPYPCNARSSKATKEAGIHEKENALVPERRGRCFVGYEQHGASTMCLSFVQIVARKDTRCFVEEVGEFFAFSYRSFFSVARNK